MSRGAITSGVNSYSGVTNKWYGWAQQGADYRDGPLRWLKIWAKLDAARLRRRLEKKR